MNKLDLEALGFTKEEIQNRVVDQAVKQLLMCSTYNEDGDEVEISSDFGRQLKKAVKQKVDETINRLAEKHILPDVGKYIENITLQQTNSWGEKTGKSMTFVEYLTNRAEHYLNEKVNYEGKSKEEVGGYSWSGTQTRITHLVHEHLHFTIAEAMKNAVKNVNSVIIPALAETCKLKLGELSTNLKVTSVINK